MVLASLPDQVDHEGPEEDPEQELGDRLHQRSSSIFLRLTIASFARFARPLPTGTFFGSAFFGGEVGAFVAGGVCFLLAMDVNPSQW